MTPSPDRVETMARLLDKQAWEEGVDGDPQNHVTACSERRQYSLLRAKNVIAADPLTAEHALVVQENADLKRQVEYEAGRRQHWQHESGKEFARAERLKGLLAEARELLGWSRSQIKVGHYSDVCVRKIDDLLSRIEKETA